MINKGKVVPFKRNGRFYFNVGLKMLNKKRFLEAANYFRMAVQTDPDNCEYRFNLAGVLAEIGNVNESITILEDTIETFNTVMPECFFALACNYFNIGKYEKAKYYFERYRDIDPGGAFVFEAINAIKFINSNLLSKQKTQKLEHIHKMVENAKKFMSDNQISKAIQILEKALKFAPDLTFVKNNLSLSYYLNGEIGKAISIAREVQKEDKQNPYANCNLALFYKSLGSIDLYKRQLKMVRNSNFETIEEIISTVDILSKLNEDKLIKIILKRLVSKHDEPIVWHFLAISYQNTGNLKKAVETWNYLKVKFPYMTIFANCFINEVTKSIEKNYSHTISYDFRTFVDYITKIDDLIKALINMSQEEFNKVWYKNDYIKDIVGYFLYKLTNEEKLKLIDKLAELNDESAIEILNNYIVNSKKRDEARNRCEKAVMKYKVAGDAMINVIELKERQ